MGSELGLPDEIVHRQPFPGPGLAVRIIGEITHEKLETLRRADAIVREEIGAWDEDREVWQYFAVLPDIRSVGVMGDERTYGHPIIIRAVASADAMTADWARLPHDLLAQDEQPHHQRGRRHQPRRLRHHEQAARHHRVGVGRGFGAVHRTYQPNSPRTPATQAGVRALGRAVPLRSYFAERMACAWTAYSAQRGYGSARPLPSVKAAAIAALSCDTSAR